MKTKTNRINKPRESYYYTLDQKTALFETFEVELTSKTAKIKTNNENIFFADKSFSNIVFPCFKLLKKEIESTGLNPPFTPPNAVRYYAFNEEIEDHENIYCIDLNSAYLSSLYILDYISIELFEKLSKLKKMDRLAVTGMLATSKIKLKYVLGELVETEKIDDNEYLRNIFFHISKYVGECLYAVKENENENFLFYWVDGIFTRKPLKSSSLRIISDFGFQYKNENVNSLKVSFEHGYKKITMLKDGKKKTFFTPKKPSLPKH